MLSWFKKKSPMVETRGAALEEPLVHYVWERKRLPDEGAMSYAFETLQLVVHSPIDGAVRVRKNLGVPFPQMEGQIWITQQGVTNGIPSMAGGIYGARQYNPDGSLADLGPSADMNMFAIANNIPHGSSTDIGNAGPINNPFPFGRVQL
jgi:hypothetical protein